jgi:hypothetical protein
MKGQPVAGRLTKGKRKSGLSMRPGFAKGDSEGKGSESQEQEWHFHELLPSEIHQKPE